MSIVFKDGMHIRLIAANKANKLSISLLSLLVSIVLPKMFMT